MVTNQQSDWAQLALKFGPGWALAALLVYFLMTSVSTAQTAIRDVLTQHVTDMQLDAQRNRYLLQAICFNVANTESERASCQEAAR